MAGAARLRRASGEDAARAAEVWLASRRQAPGVPAPIHDAEQVRVWVGELVRAEEVWLAMNGRDEAEAMMLLAGEWIEQLYVLPGCQGRGLGSALVELAQARRRSLALWTFEANTRARAFYEARGFRRSGPASSDNEEGAPALCYRWSAREGLAARTRSINDEGRP